MKFPEEKGYAECVHIVELRYTQNPEFFQDNLSFTRKFSLTKDINWAGEGDYSFCSITDHHRHLVTGVVITEEKNPVAWAELKKNSSFRAVLQFLDSEPEAKLASVRISFDQKQLRTPGAQRKNLFFAPQVVLDTQNQNPHCFVVDGNTAGMLPLQFDFSIEQNKFDSFTVTALFWAHDPCFRTEVEHEPEIPFSDYSKQTADDLEIVSLKTYTGKASFAYGNGSLDKQMGVVVKSDNKDNDKVFSEFEKKIENIFADYFVNTTSGFSDFFTVSDFLKTSKHITYKFEGLSDPERINKVMSISGTAKAKRKSLFCDGSADSLTSICPVVFTGSIEYERKFCLDEIESIFKRDFSFFPDLPFLETTPIEISADIFKPIVELKRLVVYHKDEIQEKMNTRHKLYHVSSILRAFGADGFYDAKKQEKAKCFLLSERAFTSFSSYWLKGPVMQKMFSLQKERQEHAEQATRPVSVCRLFKATQADTNINLILTAMRREQKSERFRLIKSTDTFANVLVAFDVAAVNEYSFVP